VNLNGIAAFQLAKGLIENENIPRLSHTDKYEGIPAIQLIKNLLPDQKKKIHASYKSNDYFFVGVSSK